MKIVILGAGQVGSTVAANLVSEINDITVVDCNLRALKPLKEHYDLQTVHGVACHPEILEAAGLADADIILAVTNSDEVNMAACQIAQILFNTPTKIARIRSPEYLQQKEKLFGENGLAIDVYISPEQTLTDYIAHLIAYPNALQVLDFANQRCQMVAIRAPYNGLLIGHTLHKLNNILSDIDYRVAVIFRNENAIIPDGKTIIEPNDEIFFLGSSDNIQNLLKAITDHQHKTKRVMIASGGNIGVRLGATLERDYQIKLIDIDLSTAQNAAEKLNKAIVIHGDATDMDILVEENIEKMDVFCALTNADEANIISSLLAKKMGARKIICLVNRLAYANLIDKNIIDITLSPQQTTIGSILTSVRKADVVKVHALRGGSAEAIEAIAHGDKYSSHVVGRSIEELKLPDHVMIGAIIRNNEVIIAHHDCVIETNDHLILMVTDKKSVPKIETLFQVKATFL